jgi:hypothetical protein
VFWDSINRELPLLPLANEQIRIFTQKVKNSGCTPAARFN